VRESTDNGREAPGEGASPLVSIIVPCRNERAGIGTLLLDIEAQTDLPGPLETIVADGRSDDGTTELLRERAASRSWLRILDNPRRITPVGLNLAIRASRGEFILRMDAHTRYASDYVARCLDTLRRTSAANVGGPARTIATTYVQRVIAAAYASRFAVGGARFHFADFEGPVDTVPYGCWKKSTIESVGLFDEEFVRNQDDELNLRLLLRGDTIWQSPTIRSWYSPRGTLSHLFRQYAQYGYWKVAVLRRHGRTASMRHFVPSLHLVVWLALTILALGWPAARLPFLIYTGVYAAFIALGSIVIAVRKGVALLPLLPVTLVTFHAGYGVGFLAACVARRRGSRHLGMQGLTR